ncbi:hypothetical protein I551_1150 [Mycobacterium ulcerans str. Harvey]|uniref:Uncharacterized protein n=1 Tax=Mycobacterium ulcerans str. Harvey TaxID=1299332 RepID=A0ABN0R5P7_MYCUL|nr:hypothetical protein I551_1150 [Mycobacterium ulcerans str. Harvey]
MLSYGVCMTEQSYPVEVGIHRQHYFVPSTRCSVFSCAHRSPAHWATS